MKTKKIANIVFYKFNSKGEENRQACVFYNDGTIENLSYEEGIGVCEQLAKELNITSKDSFQKMINNDIIHVLSGRDLEDRFSSFVVNENDISNRTDEDEIEPPEDINVESPRDLEDRFSSFVVDENDLSNRTYEGVIEPPDVESELGDDLNDREEPDLKDLFDGDSALDLHADIEDNPNEESDLDLDEDIEDELGEEPDLDEDIEDELDEEPDLDEDIEDIPEDELSDEPKKGKGILGWIQKGYEKAKKNRFVRRLVICAIALATGLGIYSVANRKTKEGVMTNSNIASESSNLSSNTSTQKAKISVNEARVLISGNNDYYNNYSYEQLLEVTESKSQKKSMKNLGTTITKFNGDFADAYTEKGKDIRAALSFDELVALQNAYNDYNKKEIKAYFNGADINAADMTKAYKTGTLQLMGAHVVETRKNPVDMTPLLEDEQAKEFYKKYHEMFLAAKEASGTDKVTKAKAFIDAVRKDFPITNEVRTEGIMHSDNYDLIESYKLSVVPMIAAAEMLFQNLDIDYTLSDGEIDFLNDIGLCNYAQDKFDMIQTITLTAEEDNTNPLYEQYRDSIIKMMKDKNQYVTDDKHRDLSRLDAFQDAVNWHFLIDSTGMFTGQIYYTTESHTETKTWTTTDTTYREEVTVTEKEIPAAEKAKIDSQIAAENKQAKEEATNKAEKKRKALQKAADKNAKKVKEEVEKDAKDFEDKIENANNQINENNKDNDTSNDKQINEKDFGDHNVDFDDEHSDSQGNLDNSVENITTDSSGDQTDEKLPDPNDTGAEFDKKAPTEDNNTVDSGDDNNYVDSGDDNNYTDSGDDNNYADSGDDNNFWTEDNTADSTSDQQEKIVEYEESVEEKGIKSNEELVDEYIKNMANSSSSEQSYEYTK